MFTLTADHSFVWPVKVRLPSTETPGDWDVHVFTGVFRLLSATEADALSARMKEAADEGSDAVSEQVMAQIREVLTGWREDVVDDSGAPLPFSAEALDRLCRHEPVRAAIAVAYAEAAGGARRGN